MHARGRSSQWQGFGDHPPTPFHVTFPQRASLKWVGPREGNQHALSTYPLPRDFEAAAGLPKMGRVELLKAVEQVHEHHLAHDLLARLAFYDLWLHNALYRRDEAP